MNLRNGVRTKISFSLRFVSNLSIYFVGIPKKVSRAQWLGLQGSEALNIAFETLSLPMFLFLFFHY